MSTDPETYKSYVATATPAYQQYGAKFLVRGGRSEAVEGPGRGRNVVIEFESYRRWRSPAIIRRNIRRRRNSAARPASAKSWWWKAREILFPPSVRHAGKPASGHLPPPWASLDGGRKPDGSGNAVAGTC